MLPTIRRVLARRCPRFALDENSSVEITQRPRRNAVIWKKTKRLFVALGLPQSCKEALLKLDPHLTGLRWIPAEQLHLTLSFLGDVDPLAEERLQQALRT